MPGAEPAVVLIRSVGSLAALLAVLALVISFFTEELTELVRGMQIAAFALVVLVGLGALLGTSRKS